MRGIIKCFTGLNVSRADFNTRYPVTHMHYYSTLLPVGAQDNSTLSRYTLQPVGAALKERFANIVSRLVAALSRSRAQRYKNISNGTNFCTTILVKEC